MSSSSSSAPKTAARIPNAFSAEDGAGAADADADAASQLHAKVVEVRHTQERVAQRDQNREGPPPDLPRVHIHGLGGDLGGVPGMVDGSGGGGAASAPAGRPKKRVGGDQRSAAASGGSAKTPAELKHWFRQQRRKHMSKMTPAQQERMKKNAMRQNLEQRKHRLGRKAKKIAYASASARANVMSSIATYSPALNQHQSAMEQQAVRDTASAAMEELQAVQAGRLSESESEGEIDALDDDAEVAAAAVSEKEVKTLLDELRQEPADDDERANKFKIYEQYLSVVAKSRDECLKFHAACQESLAAHEGVLRKMAASIRSIDSDGNRAINWDNLGGRWFVYDMTAQSDRNNTFIGRVFAELKRDLEMIQDNDMDCPICLENLTTVPSGVRVLHCCHKLCGECYDNWKLACQGGRVICPLCREQDFQAAVVTRTPVMVQQYLHDMHSDSEDSEDEGGAAAAPLRAQEP